MGSDDRTSAAGREARFAQWDPLGAPEKTIYCASVRLHEKGGKRHEMPAHHNLEIYLDAHIGVTSRFAQNRTSSDKDNEIRGLHRRRYAAVGRRHAKSESFCFKTLLQNTAKR